MKDYDHNESVMADNGVSYHAAGSDFCRYQSDRITETKKMKKMMRMMLPPRTLVACDEIISSAEATSPAWGPYLSARQSR